MQKGLSQIKTEYEKEIQKLMAFDALCDQNSKRKIYHQLKVGSIRNHLRKRYLSPTIDRDGFCELPWKE